MSDVQRVISALSSPIRREILALIWDRDLPAGRDRGRLPDHAAHHLAAPHGLARRRSRDDAGRRQLPPLPRPSGGGARAARQPLGRASSKWTPADDLPEVTLARASTSLAVIAAVDVDTDQATTFAAFTDPGRVLALARRARDDSTTAASRPRWSSELACAATTTSWCRRS